MPLLDVNGNTGATEFKHSGPMAVNTGVICASMVISNVYVVVPTTDVLIEVGDQVPVMPLLDIAGNTGAAELRQSEPNGLNVGVIIGLTVTSIVVVVAHWPASGVNVYVPLAVLLTAAGDQVPVMPLVDVVGNVGATEPEQIGATASKVGVALGFTVTVNVAVVAHCPASGVNV
jgi:hypothetical protein